MKTIRNYPVRSTRHQKPIVSDVFYIKNNLKKPLVIFCHGYKGYKDWGAWNLVAKYFVKKGIFFVKFNFSHNGGTLENPIDFPDLEAFGQNNYLKELDDLDDVISWLIKNVEFESDIDFSNITLIGHSRGGGIASLKASEDSRISRLISWAGTADFGTRFPADKELEKWKTDGVTYIQNSRTKQQMPLYYQFYQTFKGHEKRLTIQRAVGKLKIPHLIIHGDSDVVVLPDEARNLHKWNPRSTLRMIQGMNHTLGSLHPWTKQVMPVYLKQAVRESIDFINS